MSELSRDNKAEPRETDKLRRHRIDQHCTGSYVWYVILTLAIVNLVNYMDRMALAVLAPYIKEDLDLSDAQLGLLTGFAFAVFYAVCAVPIARWADRGTRRDIIALALMAWSVMTALCGVAQSFLQLFLARVGVGTGEAGSFAPGASILCDYVPVTRRAGVLAIHVFGNSAGIFVGMALAGWLGQAIGWRWTFVLLGVPGIILAVVVRFTLIEPARGFFEAAKEERTDSSWITPIRSLWAKKTYRLLALFLVANSFVHFGFNQWWPSFYARMFGTELSSIGLYLGIAYGAGNGVGVLLGGLVADKASQSDVAQPLRISALATALSMPVAVGSLFMPSMIGSILLVALTGLFWGISMGPVMAGIYSVVAANVRATAGSIAIFLSSVLGIGLGPLCVGLLSDVLSPLLGIEALRYALLAPVCMTAVMSVALCASVKTVANDLKAMCVAQADDNSETATPITIAIAE